MLSMRAQSSSGEGGPAEMSPLPMEPTRDRAIAMQGVICRRRIFPFFVRGNSLREIDDLRRLVLCQLLAAKGEYIIGSHRAAGLKDDIGDNEDLVRAVRFADTGTIGNCVVGFEDALDLVRGDSITEAIDEVVLAAEEPDVAIGVVASVVAGEEPTIASQPRRLLGQVPVAAGTVPDRSRERRSSPPREGVLSRGSPGSTIGSHDRVVESPHYRAESAETCSGTDSTRIRSFPPLRRFPFRSGLATPSGLPRLRCSPALMQ